MIPSVLVRQIRRGVADFLRTTFPVTNPYFRDDDGHTFIDRFLDTQPGMFQGPYLSIQLPFQRATIKAEPFPDIPLGFTPFRHQEVAFARLRGPNPKSTLIATGTGSGKSECFLLPILDHCLRHRHRDGIKAILIYPMNALAADQATRLARMISGNPNLHGQITAGMYVGGGKGGHRVMGPDFLITDRETLRLKPPDILLTNYKMLDYLLIRPADLPLWQQNEAETLRYLVVDELHTFDGAQGTDLACLIRRLKARLATPKNHLCCVGTSATLGAEAESQNLLDYASQVFGEDFDAVIGESRISAGDFLEDSFIRSMELVPPEKLDALDPETYADPQAYIGAQARLWFGDDLVPDDANDNSWFGDLAEALKGHVFFQNLLRALRGKTRRLENLLEELGQVTPGLVGADDGYRMKVVESLLALISVARTRSEDGKTWLPFLNVRFQFWKRELRRMVSSLPQVPELRFADDLNADQLKNHLAVVNCRECGATGWAGTKRKMERKLESDLQTFYTCFFSRDPKVVFLFPQYGTADVRDVDAPFYRFLCSRCLTLSTKKPQNGCPGCGGEDFIHVYMPDVRRSSHNRQRSSNDCPYCGAPSGLTILGSRAASLISVDIAQLFASPFFDDKKLLCFSDSVQDAAHRAGFFAARTFRSNFRAALQQCVQDKGEGLSLTGLHETFIAHWSGRLGDIEFLTTFLAPNMAWLPDVASLLSHEKLPADSDLRDLVDRRIGWEILSEYGYRARVGRTLEKTCSSMASVVLEKVDACLPDLLEKLRNEIGPLRELSAHQLRACMMGLLTHLRIQGGVFFPELDTYIDGFGKTYLLNRLPWMPNFGWGSRAPSFLTDKQNSRFELARSPGGSRATWCTDWLERSLFGDVALYGETVEAALDMVLDALVGAGILEQRRVRKNRVWGLKPENVHVSLEVREFRCTECSHSTHAPLAHKEAWEGAPCLRYRCSGQYISEPKRPDYYARLYALGDVARIYADEHSGLLERKDREALEIRFKASGPDRKPWYPNLLSCTPTLEMGIDIGDLSSLILCSVPPSQTQFVQRIGRAGRRDGNALDVTVANARPHDLFFFAEPLDMISGAVQAPGVFLNAPAVLERQLMAFCLDRWVEAGQASIPPRLGTVLENLEPQQADTFPHNFLTFFDNRQTTLFDAFLALFPELEASAKTALEAFITGDATCEGSLRYRITQRLFALRRERDGFRRKVQNLAGQIRRLEQNPARDKNFDDQRRDMRREQFAIKGLIRSIMDRDTYNFFTDEGLIPNYAFPEAGVLLKSVVFRRKKDVRDGDKPYDQWVYEYQRPGRAAIVELAPDNQFYAGGRKVQVDQVNMINSEIETWRLCDRCAYMELLGTRPDQKTCPRCSSPLWADEGQKRLLLRLKGVFANTSDQKSRISDDSDERKPMFYNRQMMVDFDRQDVTAAFRIDSEALPFGFEFLRRATFREVNFGPKGELGQKFSVAGVDAVRSGFTLCQKCGRVQSKRGEIRHDISCPERNKENGDALTDCVYLYREFASEAIRMLLPVTTFSGSERKLHSFIAALFLGLEKTFGGSIDHLETAVTEEPVSNSDYRKKYLVLYDTVPGGTGYLKQLTRSEADLFDVLERALAHMKACTCQNDSDKDGCYRCLFAYRRAYHMSETSRDEAIALLAEILKFRQNVVTTPSLSNVGINALFDSELEARFVEALHRARTAQRSVSLKRELVFGKPGYFLSVGDQNYLVEPQREFGKADGVSVPCRADFVFWPAQEQESRKPVVVFVDGFGYHKDRIDTDLAQRLALLQSGRYLVWSLTWRDVEHQFGLSGDYFDDFLGFGWSSKPNMHQFLRAFEGRVAFRDDLRTRTSFAWFLDYLEKPNLGVWTNTAFIHALLFLDIPPKTRSKEWDRDVREHLPGALGATVLGETETATCGRMIAHDMGGIIPWRVWVRVAREAVATCDARSIAVGAWINDTMTFRDRQSFEKTWTGYFRLLNLMQFLPHAFFVCQEGLARHAFDPLDAAVEYAAMALPIAPAEGTPWKDVRELVDPQWHRLLAHLEQNGITPPEPGFELEDEGGQVIAQAELAWVDTHVALLTEDEAEYEKVFETAGWKTQLLVRAADDMDACVDFVKGS